MPEQIVISQKMLMHLTKSQLIQAALNSDIFPKVIFIEGNKVLIALGSIEESIPQSFEEAQIFIDKIKTQILTSVDDLKFICIFPFDYAHFGEAWTEMPTSYVFLPKEFIEWENGQLKSTKLKSRESTEETLLLLNNASTKMVSKKSVNPEDLVDIPSEKEWKQSVKDVLNDIKNAKYKKVVLARTKKLDLESNQKVDLGNTLLSMHEEYPRCFTYLISLKQDQAFLGTTPEVLGKKKETEFQTMALAGTVPVYEGEETANTLLMNSEKLKDEHKIVADKIVSGLKPLTTKSVVGIEKILPLKNVFHLHTPITAKIKPGIKWARLVTALHPTPAVGGTPKEMAKQKIIASEKWGRGWYSGIIGWVDRKENFDFRVALRCALFNRGKIWAFAGAGIVEGSDPESEWEETESKFLPILRALKIMETD